MNIFDDLFVPNKNDFPKEIGEIEKLGIIEEEEKKNKKNKKSVDKKGEIKSKIN